MEASSQGAAARLTITPNALSRHARRAQRELAALGIEKNLAASQEFFARVIGLKNWNEAQQLALAASASVAQKTQQPQTTILAPKISGPGAEAVSWPNGEPLFDGIPFGEIVRNATQQGFSELSFSANEHFTGLKGGHPHALSALPVSSEDIVAIATTLSGCSAEDAQEWSQSEDGWDFMVRFERPSQEPRWKPAMRFRAKFRAFLDNGAPGARLSLRRLNDTPPKLSDLDLPPALKNALSTNQRLVIVAGSTGTGKSTLLSAALRGLLENPQKGSCKAVTYELPVEFGYDDIAMGEGSSVTQTEVGQKMPVSGRPMTFADGVRIAMRRDPDVVLVGEARDAETFEAVMDGALSGHSMWTSMHGSSVASALQRVQSLFPASERAEKMRGLWDMLKVIVAQMWLPGVNGKRVLVREYLEVDERLLGQLLANPGDAMRLVHERLDAHQSSFAHDARAKHAAGLITDNDLQRVLAMQKSERSNNGE